MENREKNEQIAQACATLLAEPKVRFAGVINRMGKLIGGKFKEGITSHLQDKEDGMVYMQLAMEIFLRKEYDEKLGEIEYVLSKRSKVSIIQVPVGKYLALVSAEPNADVDAIVKKTKSVLTSILSD